MNMPTPVDWGHVPEVVALMGGVLLLVLWLIRQR